MYKIRRTNFGFHLSFGGFIRGPEMEQWALDSEKALAGVSRKFGVLIDMRTLKPLPADAQAPMQKGQKLYKSKGMARSAVILANAVTCGQFRRIAKETGIYQWERYVDASQNPNWKQAALDWVRHGVDPDLAGAR